MQTLFEWLKNLSLSMWISQSPSIWAFPFVLFLHAVGMGMSAGLAFIITMRLLGVASPLPVSSMRVLFKWFWAGFCLSLVSGIILFMSDATGIGNVPVFYAKLICVIVALVMMVPLRAFVDSDRSDFEIPTRIKSIAAVSLVLWLAVLVTGRLIAYAVEANQGFAIRIHEPARTAERHVL